MLESKKNSRIKGYGLDPPSKLDAVKALAKFMDEKEAEILWESACTTHNILANTDKIEELESVFHEIANRPGTIGVIGKSLLIRANSYKLLNRRNNG